MNGKKEKKKKPKTSPVRTHYLLTVIYVFNLITVTLYNNAGFI